MNLRDLAITSAALYLIIVLRYVLVAGAFYWAFWMRNQERWAARRLQDTSPAPETVKSEIRWSLLTSIIFAVPGAFMIEAWKNGSTRIYTDVATYGWPYLLASVALYMFLHDTYFYWTHRWMHKNPRIFRVFHQVHHNSPNPTPWAAFSFHPYESVIGALIIPVLVFFIPIHIGALLFVLTAMTLFSVINHNGYEILPRTWVRNGVGSLMITATHHNLHHTRSNCNYGLYFRLWDKWLKTDRMPEAVKTPRPRSRPATMAETPNTIV